ncbi:amino acid/amide ABC transporter membrane protein 1, HAAT family (TC 3.A.1.4.-) [Enhydrobacter aerosaccus]|uniref:Amino acid/amide ABC transporter membrane protein 1, HAAT family (TC 3.A.1.4.-) n=1 Tax=Enhydrobacter aerosaccus TaxID=225324 RepID=A0A1T4NZN3_9HYPH|nr:branched-chain amino acid ABC transporter permease [Enhydrobacter aerosaccus]SJZ84572.1 amino acid/amide ABC transporter membrane protein 1, HAAT family (TC 3.A.1.4.-) [Enhydrobacter aerosaccus]
MTIDATYLLQLTLNGIALGLLYALIAVGLSLIFGVMEIINFAHGEILMLGAFAMTFALPVLGLLYWPALAAAILATMLAGLLIYEVLLARLRTDEFERSILITLGLSIILIHTAQYFFTATPRMVDTQYGFDGVEIGTIRLTWTRLIGAAAALVAFAGLYLTLRFTQFGRAMRAIAQNREAALMVGIRPRVVARNAMILAAGLCGLAGSAIAPIQLVTPYMGQFLIFKAFALVTIGGLGNIPGAVVAAVALGLIESWVGGFFASAWQEGAVFLVMIVVLLLRPEGLFKRGGMRVG